MVSHHLSNTCCAFDFLSVFFYFSHTISPTVWHCHILSHEDNEMMRPLCVYDPTDEITTLNNCCPDGYEYDTEVWDSDNALACIEIPGWTPEPTPDCSIYRNKKKCDKDANCRWKWLPGICVENECAEEKADYEEAKEQYKTCAAAEDISLGWFFNEELDAAEDPMEQLSASSDRAGLKVSAILAGLFLLLWN